jgi:hypothetical protein
MKTYKENTMAEERPNLISLDEVTKDWKISKWIKFKVKVSMKMRHISYLINSKYRRFIPERVYYKFYNIQELIKNTNLNDILFYLKEKHGEEFTPDLESAYINVYNYMCGCEIIPAEDYEDDPNYKVYYILVRNGSVLGIGNSYKYKDDDEHFVNVPHNYFPKQPFYHEHYAIELSDWKYIAGLPYRSERKIRNNNGKIVAEILWEITFLGFTPEDVSCKVDVLKDRMDTVNEILDEQPIE